jgi:hypothetical protein
MVRSLDESGDEARQRTLNELLWPFFGTEPEAEVYEVHFDFSPTTERQPGYRVDRTLYRPHRSFPILVFERRETFVEEL